MYIFVVFLTMLPKVFLTMLLKVFLTMLLKVFLTVVCRLVEEVKEKTGIALENDDVYMSTTFESFINTVVIKSRGGDAVELEYDAVSVCVCVGGGGGGLLGAFITLV